jgi:hypothetical protein
MTGQRRRNPSADPTAERTADQSTQENSGLQATVQDVRPQPDLESAREREEDADDVLSRNAERRYDTPRRYESETADPTRRSDDSTPDTNI